MSDFITGLDLDGVVYQFERTARYMLRRRIASRGEEVPEILSHPATAWNSIQEAVSSADWTWLWTEAVEQGLFRNGHIVCGAVEGAIELTNLGDLVLITHRPKAAVNDTLAWLTVMFNRVRLAGVVIQSNGEHKSEVVPTPDAYVDDATHVADDILDHTKAMMILYDQPWNQGYENDWHDTLRGSRLLRAHGWQDVVRAVRLVKEADLARV